MWKILLTHETLTSSIVEEVIEIAEEEKAKEEYNRLSKSEQTLKISLCKVIEEVNYLN